MLGKLALLLKSKLALAILGASLAAGGGATVALASSSGQTQLPLISQLKSHQQHEAATATPTEHSSQNSHQESTPSATSTSHNSGQQAEGTITSIDTGMSSFLLAPEHGATVTVVVNAQTVFEGGLSEFAALTVGQHVEAKGSIQTDGSLLATKVEGQSETADDNQGNGDAQNHAKSQQELTGTVTSIDATGTSFLLTLANGATQTIVVSSTTAFEGVFHSFADLSTGMSVKVKGTLQADGTLAASTIHREDSSSGDSHNSHDGHGSHSGTSNGGNEDSKGGASHTSNNGSGSGSSHNGDHGGDGGSDSHSNGSGDANENDN